MKKLLVMLMILAVAGAVPVFAEGTVNTFLDNRSKSDIHPISETGSMVHMVYKPVSEVKDKVFETASPVTTPVMDVAKKIVNTTWDIITFKSFRDKSKE